MGESAQHFRLVQVILEHVKVEYATLSALAIVDDCSKSLFGEKPPKISGSVPDVFGFDTPRSVTIIGEAKTDNDLTTARSRAQIEGFYEFLTYQESGNLILAVSPAAFATANAMVRRLSKTFTRGPVSVTVLMG